MDQQARGRAVAAAVLLALVAGLAACGRPDRPTHAVHPPETPVAIAPPGPTAPPSATAVPLPHSEHRPNILVIETDDMRWDELRWMPHVQRLIADTGLSFQNSFAPYPLCCPSRSSFLTGEYAHNHGVLSHESPFGFGAFHDRRTVATELQRHGYRTALIGKYLNGYGQQPIPGTTRSSLHYVPPGWSRWLAGSDHLWHPWEQVQGGTYAYENLTQNVDGRIATWPGQYSTDVLARQARHVIGQFAARRTPWFVWWTPVAPHHGSPAEADDPGTTYDAKGRPTTWDTPARPNWVKGRFDKLITHGLGTPVGHPAEADVSDKPRYLRRNPELNFLERRAERTVSRQRAEALWALDVQVGRTLRYLHRTGQYHRTVIVFTSDNGYYLGEHRKRQGKINLHEPSLRVPLLMTGPGVPRGDRYDPVTTVDLAPTFLSYAGVKGGMPGADGENLRPLITGGDRGWTRAVVTEGRMAEPRYLANTTRGGFNSQLDTRGLRLGRWKLTVYSTGEKELYDLRRDPLELHGLQKDPAYAGTLHEMMHLWRVYKDCAGRTCRVPLPADLQLSPAQERAITVHEVARTRAYYSDPGFANGPLLR